MIAILSPAKKLLPFEKTPAIAVENTKAVFDKEAQELINILRKKTVEEIATLMKLSPALAQLNFERYNNWNLKHHLQNAQTAVLTFNGAAYLGLDAATFSSQALAYSQKHLRILSGLYGLLKPLDLMQAYRLEMGTRLENTQGKNLYHFWGEKIQQQLQKELNADDNILVNLASNEYFKAVKAKDLKAKIITCHFKDRNKAGEYKTIMAYAKKARGMMARYIIQNEIEQIEDLKAFDTEKYSFSPAMSTENEFTFVR